MSRPYGPQWAATTRQLAVRRVLLGLSQDDVAKAARTTRGAISEIERGTRVPTVELLIRIARVYGLRLALTSAEEPP